IATIRGIQQPGPSRVSRRADSVSVSPSMSITLSRLATPVTSVTSRRFTSNAPATARSAASVAFPSTARPVTATTRAPPYRPPTEVRADPGFTRIANRTSWPVSLDADDRRDLDQARANGLGADGLGRGLAALRRVLGGADHDDRAGRAAQAGADHR